MQKVVKKGERRVKLDTEKDECLYNSHSYTGPNQNRWLEFYAHRMKSAGVLSDGDTPDPNDYVFYLLHVSQWQGENTYISEISLEEAKDFVSEHYYEMEDTFGLLNEEELE